ncbi:MAG: hypothetical protein V1772_09140 [Chloroflexota bacterium]
MRRIVWAAGWALALGLALAGACLAAEGAAAVEAEAFDAAKLLLPLVAAATLVERLIEMGFDYYENAVLTLAKIPGQGKEYVTWLKGRIEALRAQMIGAKDAAALRVAEDKLALFEDRLLDHLKSPAYMSWKRKLSMLFGILLGMGVALVSRRGLFGLLRLGPWAEATGAWPWVDYVITGLIIGTGSAPVHSLIGLIQNTRDAVLGARQLWTSRALGLQEAAAGPSTALVSALKQEVAALRKQNEGLAAAVAATREHLVAEAAASGDERLKRAAEGLALPDYDLEALPEGPQAEPEAWGAEERRRYLARRLR